MPTIASKINGVCNVDGRALLMKSSRLLSLLGKVRINHLLESSRVCHPVALGFGNNKLRCECLSVVRSTSIISGEITDSAQFEWVSTESNLTIARGQYKSE